MAVITVTVTEWFETPGETEGAFTGSTLNRITIGDTYTVTAIDYNNQTITLQH